MAPLGKLATLAAVVVSTASAFVTAPSIQPRPSASADSASATAATRSIAARACLRPNVRRASPSTALHSSTAEEVVGYQLDGNDIRGPLQPVEDTILIKVDAPKEVTAGGLFLPQTKKDPPTRGTVVATGPGKRHWDTGVQIPIKVNVGDRVVFGNYDGTSVQFQGSEHLLMRDQELLMAYDGEDIDLDTVRMVGDRVLLRIKATPKGSTTSAAGVLIAESATRSNRPTIGVVEKVGPGRMVPSGKMMPMYVKPGDRVKYKDFAAEIVSIAGMQTETEELVVIRNVDVLARW